VKLAVATLAAAAAVAPLRTVQTVPVARATGVDVFAGTVYVRSGVGSLGALEVFAGGRLRKIQCVTRHVRGCVTGGGLETPAALGVSPDGRSAYLAAQNGRALGVYQRLASGKLVPAGSVTGLAHPRSVAVSPDGHNVYVGGDELWVFARDPLSGGLSLVQTVAGGANALAVSPDGTTLYAGSGGGYHGTLTAFARTADSGTLTQTAQVASPTTPGIEQPAQLVADDGGVYALATVSGAVTRLDPTLAETAIARSLPLAFGLAVTPDRVYVAYRDGVAALDPSLQPVGTFKLKHATGVAASGRTVYAVSTGRVTVFSAR
jgi:DNA-binding beta-propeller fold protein YncE